MVCDMGSEEVERVFRIGNTVQSQCAVDLRQLIDPKQLNQFQNSNYFFELFLVDIDGSLIDVPVLITNVKLESGNSNDQVDSSAQMLTRRFFLFDTISGIRDGEYPGGTPTTIQYLSSMKLMIQLDNENPEKIYLPILKLTYRARTVSLI